MLQWGTSYLTDKGFDESRLTTELLLAHVLQCKRIDLYTKFDKPLSDIELGVFKEIFKRRLAHEPLQYIIGETEFMGLKFFVDQRVLIPRPETEMLIEAAAKICSQSFADQPQIRILDIGTGSGCIAVSCAKMIPTAAVQAIEKSAGALEIAKRNAAENNVSDRIEFTECDVLQIQSRDFIDGFHLVLSNPPYISRQNFDGLAPEIRDYEPRFSLTDDGDGLSFYRLFSSAMRPLLKDNGMILVEHAFDQAEKVESIFCAEGWRRIEKFKDYSGHFRCLAAAVSEER